MTDTFLDLFRDERPSGQVVGRSNPDGVRRLGIDVERVIGIDHGALRIRPLLQPAWGRAGLAYGPYRRKNGLAFGVFVLNGHNTSQSGDLTESLKRRLGRWAKGSEADPIHTRLWRWLRYGHKRTTLRQMLRWTLLYLESIWRRSQDKEPKALDENLAVGWFSAVVPQEPLGAGHAFIVHAAGPQNGELWLGVGREALSGIVGLQNIPIYYVIVLRAQGAAYYAASIPNAHGLCSFPMMRPLAIDASQQDEALYAGVYQSVLGQIGFRVDTRVYAAQVAEIGKLATWYGTAHAADLLTGAGLLEASMAAVGGTWQTITGQYARTAAGLSPLGKHNLARLDPGEPSGLVHAHLKSHDRNVALSIVWRYQDEANYWRLQLSDTGCKLLLNEAATLTTVASDEQQRLHPGTVQAVQLTDDGTTIAAYLDGQLIFNARVCDPRLSQATGVGLYHADHKQTATVFAFEAHPRAVPIPGEFNLPAPWLAAGDIVVASDDFGASSGALEGRVTPIGGKIWQKQMGAGNIALAEQSAKVQASVQQPNPGRTAYTIAWDMPDFAEVQVSIQPPGTMRGEGERGRSGLIFWQDEENYIIINIWLDDHYHGASISSFFYLQGFEDIYDAVWTNVGARVRWGVPCRLRVIFDGMCYLAYVDDEPVLFRALRDVYPKQKPLAINRVGIVANWEWGNDTGSRFNSFSAKAKR